jgi:hypothetical protein
LRDSAWAAACAGSTVQLSYKKNWPQKRPVLLQPYIIEAPQAPRDD